MTHIALARKWRPKTLNDLVGQPHVVETLSHALDNNQLHHAYLFTGLRGVGKTSIARIFAKALNCEQGISSTPCGQCSACLEIDQGRHMDLIEVDAASKTKVEDTRELLESAQYSPTRGRFKIYLIDEVHMLSGHSFNALLKTLEEPPAHVKFLLATTDPQKLPATILSRCLRFHLKTIPLNTLTERMSHILEAESTPFEPQAVHLIAQAAKGSLRDGLSLLEQAIAFSQGELNYDKTAELLGVIAPDHLYQILDQLLTNKGSALMQTARDLGDQGVSFATVLQNLLELLHAVSLAQIVPDTAALNTQFKPEKITAFAGQATPEQIQLYYQIALKCQQDLDYAPSHQTGFEMTLLRMLAFMPAAGNEAKPIIKPQPVIQQAKQLAPTATAPKQVAPTPIASVKQATSTQTPKETPIASSSTFVWEEVLPQLKLTGMTQTIAAHAALCSFKDGKLRLMVDTNHAAMLNDKHRQRIQEALQQHLNQNIQLDIRVEKPTSQTPAQVEATQKQQKKEAAIQSMQSDQLTQAIMEQFDATLNEDSVVEKA